MGTERHKPTNWLTVNEVAAELGVCTRTVRRWIRAGAMPAIRTPGGRELRIPQDYADRIGTAA